MSGNVERRVAELVEMAEPTPVPSPARRAQAIAAMEAADDANSLRRMRLGHARAIIYAAAAVMVAVVVAAIALRGAGDRRPRALPTIAKAAPTAIPESRSEPGINRTVATGAMGKTHRAEATAPCPTTREGPAIQSLVAVIAVRQPAGDGAGHALQIGDRLSSGTIVRTGAGGRVNLITRRGSELALDANSALALARDGRSAELRRGRLYCRDRTHEFALIRTAAGRIELLGTTIDAAVKDHTVAVTVVEGKVRLANDHGAALVSAGKKSVLTAALPPDSGETVNTLAETAWYDSRGAIVSESGHIAYTVREAETLLTEVWVMSADGSAKRRVRSYVGLAWPEGPWLGGSQRHMLRTSTPIWTLPDFTNRRADGNRGESMWDPRDDKWFLDVASGQDAPFGLPPEYRMFKWALSPDATRTAFSGVRIGDPSASGKSPLHIWVYDLQTGVVTGVAEGASLAPITWSPDGLSLVFSLWRTDEMDLELALVDTRTREVTDLGVVGADPAFSPDGERIAYAGEFERHDIIGENYPLSGSLFLLDLRPGAQPQRLSPAGEGVCHPHWSPDGTRILYQVDHFDRDAPPWTSSLHVTSVDGSGTKEIYRGPSVYPVSWAASGNAVYTRSQDKSLLIAADGGGVVATLGGNRDDSFLGPAEQQQTNAAAAAIREAVFQFAVGKVREFEGKAVQAKAAYRRAMDIFVGLAWRYPLVQFSTTDVLIYADKLAELAQRPTDAIQMETCKAHISYLSMMLPWYAKEHDGTYAPDLPALRRWMATKESTIDGWPVQRADILKAMFRCPEGHTFVYTPPAPRTSPKAGDVILSCPHHPKLRIVWDNVRGRLRPKPLHLANMTNWASD